MNVDQKWIPLMVRLDDYLEFASLVVEREGPRAPSEVAIAASIEVGRPHVGRPVMQDVPEGSIDIVERALSELEVWPVEQLRRLAAGEVLTTQRWTRAMDVCGPHAGDFFSTAQVAAKAGMGINEWRDATRKISRHLWRHYDGRNAPLAAVWGPDIGQNDGQFYWGMNAEQAEAWAQARGDVH